MTHASVRFERVKNLQIGVILDASFQDNLHSPDVLVLGQLHYERKAGHLNGRSLNTIQWYLELLTTELVFYPEPASKLSLNSQVIYGANSKIRSSASAGNMLLCCDGTTK